MIAALLTYLYTLDHADEGPQMNFGLPVEIESPANEEEEEEEIEIVRKETNLVVDAFDKDKIIINDDQWDIGDTLSRSSTARDTPSPSHHTIARIPIDRNPARPLSPLALHVQMYKAGFRFGIPCLPPLASNFFEWVMWEKKISNEELIEAASCAWEDCDDH